MQRAGHRYAPMNRSVPVATTPAGRHRFGSEKSPRIEGKIRAAVVDAHHVQVRRHLTSMVGLMIEHLHEQKPPRKPPLSLQALTVDCDLLQQPNRFDGARPSAQLGIEKSSFSSKLLESLVLPFELQRRRRTRIDVP